MVKNPSPYNLDGQTLTLRKAYSIAKGQKVALDSKALGRVERCRGFIEAEAEKKEPIYGVNTGFGYLAKVHIAEKDLEALQKNLLLSHASGYGKPFDIPSTRLAMALRLHVLLKGHTGVSLETVTLLKELINKEIYPLIPEYGSVGASGDLAPLAHLALPLIGQGFVLYQGVVIKAEDALKKEGLTPLTLKKKEGLGLINGTQMMLSLGTIALFEGMKLMELSHKVCALTYEASRAHLSSLNPLIHKARGHKGQIHVAASILKELEGSYLFSLEKREKVQDPYSLRCAPQVHGASLEGLQFAIGIAETELNGATDNPLVFPEEEKVLSGGNFHGQYLALAFDTAAIALAEMGNISERRIECLLNPHLSGLPPFLAKEDGINSGYMASQYLAASLVNENKLLANPASTDSIPGNVGIEDHVSMGMTSAKKLRKLVGNVEVIFAIEALLAAQAIDLLNKKKLGAGSQLLYKQLREKVPTLDCDRIIAEDVRLAKEVIHEMLQEDFS